MKARVKATGEIIEVIGEGIQNSNMVMAAHGEWFTKDELDIVPLSWKPFEPTYWQKLEHQYAGMAMQGILSNSELFKATAKNAEEFGLEVRQALAIDAKVYATALVEKLKNEQL